MGQDNPDSFFVLSSYAIRKTLFLPEKKQLGFGFNLALE
jgi:hypothetical protein